MYRYVNLNAWSKLGNYAKSLAKGPKSTTWVWELHSNAHDYLFHATGSTTATNQLVDGSSVRRKVLASNFAHLSVVLLWLGGMHFHGAYLSNYTAWLKSPIDVKPSAQFVWPIVGQSILNADVGGYFQGIYITSGLFHLWRSEGIVSSVQLKYASVAALLVSTICLVLAYIQQHVVSYTEYGSSTGFYKKLSVILPHHLSIVGGLGSISWAGHQVHISTPVNQLLDMGIEQDLIPSPQDLLSRDVITAIDPNFGKGLQFGSGSTTYTGSGLFTGQINPVTGSIQMSQIAEHHLYVGLVFLLGGIIYSRNSAYSSHPWGKVSRSGDLANSWNAALSLNLFFTGSASIFHAFQLFKFPVYPYMAVDYATSISMYTHHMWLGGFFIVGAAAHACIFMVTELQSSITMARAKRGVQPVTDLTKLVSHRDILVGHLIWVCILLGMHAFGIFVHNDTMQALGRLEDCFGDNAISLEPIFAFNTLNYAKVGTLSNLDFYAIDGKLMSTTMEFGTADFMVSHIHAFNIHVTTLILVKGVLYSRSSRLVSDKYQLGFRYPCDGPGRGGTCQISPWDHIYLGLFWMYNSIAVIIFNYSWKMQSDVWGKVDGGKITHLTAGDFASNATTINGWLRNFLWSQSAQVIQSYGTAQSGYGLIFLGAHFVWALSLMFLFSGRGYWQELIESIVWAHLKLKIVPNIQPRALSITQGRAVGVTHYILGGIGCTWSFFLARAVSFK